MCGSRTSVLHSLWRKGLRLTRPNLSGKRLLASAKLMLRMFRDYLLNPLHVGQQVMAVTPVAHAIDGSVESISNFELVVRWVDGQSTTYHPYNTNGHLLAVKGDQLTVERTTNALYVRHKGRLVYKRWLQDANYGLVFDQKGGY